MALSSPNISKIINTNIKVIVWFENTISIYKPDNDLMGGFVYFQNTYFYE